MKLPASVATGLEIALNRYLDLDPVVHERLAELDGRLIALQFDGIDLRILLRAGREGISVLNDSGQAADTVLHGSPLGMTRLGLGGNTTGTLFSGAVEIEGDVETGQAFKAILDEMDIDWEEQLSRLTGDVIAHQLGNVARSSGSLLAHGRSTLMQDLSEYLQEELRVLPARIEVNNFIDDVSQLGMAMDRLEARLARLRALVPAESPKVGGTT
ncbi:MAG: sterol-binding protein [Halobacteria archaeon]|nr:sterol-binding protein [Halobacteria archaeon]